MITLPTSPAPAAVNWSLSDKGGTLAGGLGGTSQRVNRLGNRWRCEVVMPALTAQQAREWSAALSKGLRDGVAFKFTQASLSVLSEGTPLVNGASQTGNALACDGFTTGFVAYAGQFFSITTGGQRYVYMVQETTKSASGAFAALPIEPALRVSPADNDVIEFAAPHIEGLLVEAPMWGVDVDHISRGFAFAIEETR